MAFHRPVVVSKPFVILPLHEDGAGNVTLSPPRQDRGVIGIRSHDEDTSNLFSSTPEYFKYIRINSSTVVTKMEGAERFTPSYPINISSAQKVEKASLYDSRG